MITFGYREKLILATEINDNIVDASPFMDDQTKQALKALTKYIREFLASYLKTNSYQQKTLTSELLRYWNETIKPDTEKFWTGLKKNGVDFERKDPLRFALDKNRFRTVEQGIDARIFWTELKILTTVKERFLDTEIEQINNLIIEDKNRRLEVLKKCLRKKEIPQTQYLKFGECMAYFANCKLFSNYFKQEEVEELYDIWKNFKST
jgi:hypothetical protein